MLTRIPLSSVANVLLMLVYVQILSCYEKHSNMLHFQSTTRSRKWSPNTLRLRGGSTSTSLPYTAHYIAPNYTSVPLVAWRELTTPSSETTDLPRRRVIEVELDCSQTGWILEPGDCLGVRCANSPEDVRELVSLLGGDNTPDSEGQPLPAKHEVAPQALA